MTVETTTTEIVPKLQFDSPLETALATNDQFDARLLPLKSLAEEMVVRTREDYEKIGQVLSEVRSIRKNEIVPLWAPFNGVLNRIKDFVRQKQQKAENLCELIDGLCRSKMKSYEIAEAQSAAREQKRQPEGVTVQAAIPAVAGYKRSTTYPITVEDGKALLRELLRSYKKADTKRVQFLSQFVMLDEKALAAHARDLKDPKKFNSEIPGVTCRKDGA